MNKIDTIFEQCLEQIEAGQSTIEECAAQYPEYAAELTSLLGASARLARGAEVKPSPVFRSRTRTELNAYIHANPRQKRPAPFIWRLSYNLVTTLLAFVVLGTAIAQRAVPGDTLFPWKLTSERMWRAVSIDRLATDLTLANRRVRELVRVYNDEDRRVRAIENYQKVLVSFKADEDIAHQARIVPVLRGHQQSLNEAGITIPELDSYFSPETNGDSGDHNGPLTVGLFLLVPSFGRAGI